MMCETKIKNNKDVKDKENDIIDKTNRWIDKRRFLYRSGHRSER